MTNNLNTQQLEELVQSLAWNDEYGCYTRAGFEKIIWPQIAPKAQWIAYFDIDDMGKLNEVYTHAGVNAIIKKCITMRASDFMTGQRYSGDEFIIVITDDVPGRRESNPIELCLRLAEAMRENGISATFAIAPVISDSLVENVEPAVKLVEVAKKENRRGSISVGEGSPR